MVYGPAAAGRLPSWTVIVLRCPLRTMSTCASCPGRRGSIALARSDAARTGRPVRFQAEPVQPGGDVIVAVEGHPVHGGTDLSSALEPLHPGDRAQLEIVRRGKHKTVTVRLAARPKETGP